MLLREGKPKHLAFLRRAGCVESSPHDPAEPAKGRNKIGQCRQGQKETGRDLMKNNIAACHQEGGLARPSEQAAHNPLGQQLRSAVLYDV